MGTALITGASAGLGADFARLFAADGHDLILVARRRERLEELAAELSAVTCSVEAVDLGDRVARDGLIERVQASGKTVDFLVNNAGFGSNGPFVELPLEPELGQIQVNIEALVHLTHAFLPQMVERGSGKVLNIASTAGFQGGPYMATYYATKAFVVTFTDGLAIELKGTGVTVTAHCPGATATEFAAIAGNDKTALFQRSGVATSAEVAQHAYRAMMAGKTLSVHGALNSIGVFGTRFIPRKVAAGIAASLNKVQ